MFLTYFQVLPVWALFLDNILPFEKRVLFPWQLKHCYYDEINKIYWDLNLLRHKTIYELFVRIITNYL